MKTTVDERREALREETRSLFKKFFGTEPAPFFENYVNERVPEEERLGTLRVMRSSLERLSKAQLIPPRESLYSLIFDLVNYSYGEWWFSIRDLVDQNQKLTLSDDPAYVDRVALKVSLKFTILVRGVRAGKLKISSLSPYSPVNTALKALLVYLINLNSPLAKNDPQKTLVIDLFDRIFRKAHGTLKMLSMGLGNEAYASWRTLHEAECILALLVRNGKPLEDAYVRHIVYNNAFRGSIPDKERVNQIFVDMKEDMKNRDLKSKDMKKFIEYGWLYSSSEYQTLVQDSKLFEKYAIAKTSPGEATLYVLGPGPAQGDPDYELFQKRKEVLSQWNHDRLKDFKLNFRDGIEEMAGLTRYSEWYETASEVTHSSAVFFYANDQFFFDLSTVALYQLSLRVAELYLLKMKEQFEKQPRSYELTIRLIEMCKGMSADQGRRFQRLYGISVLDEEADQRALSESQDGRGVTKPGPILKEEEDKG